MAIDYLNKNDNNLLWFISYLEVKNMKIIQKLGAKKRVQLHSCEFLHYMKSGVLIQLRMW